MNKIKSKTPITLLTLLLLLSTSAEACGIWMSLLTLPEVIIIAAVLSCITYTVVKGKLEALVFILIWGIVFLGDLAGYNYHFFMFRRLLLIFTTGIIIYKLRKKYVTQGNYTKYRLLTVVLIITVSYNIYWNRFVNCSTYCQSNLKNFGTALEMYRVDNKAYPSELKDLTPRYLKTILLCDPGFKKREFRPIPYKYEVNMKNNSYTLSCQSLNHTFNWPQGYPIYISEYGLISDPHSIPSEYYLAVSRGDEETVKKMINEGADVDKFENDTNEIPLGTAAANGHLNIVKLLIERGADVNSKDMSLETPLYHASTSLYYKDEKDNDIEKIILLLLEKNANPNTGNRSGETLLHHMVRWNYPNRLRLLLEKGADFTIKNNDGKTPLHIAAKDSSKESIKLLIEAGANINSQDKTGNTPLHYAITANLPHNPENIKTLLENKADINIKNNQGETPMDWAVRKDNKEAVTLLKNQHPRNH